MKDGFFISLLNNAVLLLAMATVYDLLFRNALKPQSRTRQIFGGLTLGLLTCGLILASVTLTPGIVFDTRSVLLSVSGLFFGPIPTLIAMAMGSAFRLAHGGAAAWTGVSVILATGGIGLLWGRAKKKPLEETGVFEFWLFGVVNHLVMIALMFTLPLKTALHVVSTIALPVLLIYPALTVAFGLLLRDRARRWRMKQALTESEATYRNLFENSHAIMLLIDPQNGRIVNANTAAETFYGWSTQQMQEMTIAQINTLPQKELRKVIAEAETRRLHNFRFQHRRADGSVRDVEVISGPVTLGGKKQLYSIIRDITEEQQIQTERKQLLEDAEQSRRILLSVVEDLNLAKSDLEKRMNELAQFNKAAVGRELRMVELKKEINALCRELGRKEPYLTQPN
jgi:PAS domain S-box-containing protein